MNAPSSARLLPVSVIAGRVRWDVRGLRGQGGLARRIERDLAGLVGVRTATASLYSGRLLLEYDSGQSYAEICARVERRIAPLFAMSTATSGTAGDTEVDRTIGIVTGAVLGVGWRLVRRLLEAQGAASVALADGRMEALIAPHVAAFRQAATGALGANALGVVRIFAIGLAVNACAYRRLPGMLGLVRGPVAAILLSLVAVTATLWRARLRRRSQIRWSAAARDVQHGLRLMVWAHIERMEVSQFDDDQRAMTISVIGGDINQCERGLDAAFGLIDLACNTMLFGAALVVMAPAVGVSAMLPIFSLVLLSAFLHPRVQARIARIGVASGGLDAVLSDSLGGVTTVRSFTAERNEFARIAQASDAYRRRSREALDPAITLPLLMEATILVGQVATYLLNSRAFAAGQTLGAFSIVNTSIGNLLFPFTTLGPVIDNMEKGWSAAQRIALFLGRVRFEDDVAAPRAMGAICGQVRFQDVRFAYAGRQPVFSQLSLEFKARAWTSVVGLTGSGKSTLVKLLLRFYRPLSGAIMLDDADIAQISLQDLRGAVALVSQDIYLFSRSVYENIAIGRPGADRADVMAAARTAQAHAFIEGLPNGYDTMLGNNGHALSGGERQRIAIARALLKDAPLLIFDEATSSLDSNTELAMQAALRPLFAGRTVIAIAHRLASVRNADHIIVLEHGTVLEQGTHADLIGSGGLYRDLWLSQSGIDPGTPAPWSASTDT